MSWLSRWRGKHVTKIYVDGVWDLFHYGHVEMLRHAKSLGDYLIVGIHSDKDVAKYKRKPIMVLRERHRVVSAIKWVDNTIQEAPLVITRKLIWDFKIDIVLHGTDKDENFKKMYEVPIKLGIMRYAPYTKGISTTAIIGRING